MTSTCDTLELWRQRKWNTQTIVSTSVKHLNNVNISDTLEQLRQRKWYILSLTQVTHLNYDVNVTHLNNDVNVSDTLE
jgi:hypothetical protein